MENHGWKKKYHEKHQLFFSTAWLEYTTVRETKIRWGNGIFQVLMMKRYLFHHQAYAGWWLTYPPEKYESQIGSSSQLLGKIKFMFQTTIFPFHLSTFRKGIELWMQPARVVPNHQPATRPRASLVGG